MSYSLRAVAVSLWLSVGTVYAESPVQAVEAMRHARLSEGFEARMNVFVIAPDGRRAMPMKIAVIGQMRENRQRLLVRGISPESVRDRVVIAERNASGRIQSYSYAGRFDGAAKSVDPFSRIFGSGLVLWDLFTPWWDWPLQADVTGKPAGDHACLWVSSQTKEAASASIRTVESCVEAKAALAWQTRLLNAQREPVREIKVSSAVRRSVGAGLAAKKLSIVEANKTVTEIEVYAGDEEYVISPEMFAPLEREH